MLSLIIKVPLKLDHGKYIRYGLPVPVYALKFSLSLLAIFQCTTAPFSDSPPYFPDRNFCLTANRNPFCASRRKKMPSQLLYGTKNRLACQAVFYIKISSEYPIPMNFAHNIFYTSSHCHRGRDRCVLLLDLYVHKEYSPLFQTRQDHHRLCQRTRSLFH